VIDSLFWTVFVNKISYVMSNTVSVQSCCHVLGLSKVFQSEGTESVLPAIGARTTKHGAT